jgi:His-Xaa-Ser system protein HxsD
MSMSEVGFGVSNLPDGTLVVRFDHAIYRPNSVKKAAYKYGGLFSVLVEQSGDSTIVSLKPTATCQNPDEAAGQFCNEVLDQELREEIATETRGIRDLLLAHTFSKTSLIDSEMETADFESVADSRTLGTVNRS